MAKIAPVKTPSTATANYGTNGGSPNAAQNWSTNFSADIPAILSAAAASVGNWQAAVSTAMAASNFVAGLNKAKSNVAAIQTKVQTVSKASYTAGVKAAAGPNGNYAQFSGKYQPAVQAQVQQLNATNPRGPKGTNQGRMIAFNDWITAQHGAFRVK